MQDYVSHLGLIGFLSGPHLGACSDLVTARGCHPRGDFTFLAALAYISVPHYLTPRGAERSKSSLACSEFTKLHRWCKARTELAFARLCASARLCSLARLCARLHAFARLHPFARACTPLRLCTPLPFWMIHIAGALSVLYEQVFVECLDHQTQETWPRSLLPHLWLCDLVMIRSWDTEVKCNSTQRYSTTQHASSTGLNRRAGTQSPATLT